MTIELALAISVISVSFSVYFGLKNNKRSDNGEIASRAAAQAITDTKLDEIIRNVSDIKSEIANTRKDVQQVVIDVAQLQSSYKSEHKRIDRIERVLDLKRENLDEEG